MTRTFIPVSHQLKKELRKECIVQGRTYDSLVSELLRQWRENNGKV